MKKSAQREDKSRNTTKVSRANRKATMSNLVSYIYIYAGRHKRNNGTNKGAWGMPWLSEAKKDVTSCEKLRRVANTP